MTGCYLQPCIVSICLQKCITSSFFVSFQTSTSGGGSGGSLWATCQQFTGNGKIEAKGGNGNSYGGGGAGGRITVNYVTGGFHSDHADARGGHGGSASNAEHGGPGVIYLDGKSPVVKNLRIDNKGRKPLVRMFFFFLWTSEKFLFFFKSSF